jgi:putative PEP-CTERM system histidine kinase
MPSLAVILADWGHALAAALFAALAIWASRRREAGRAMQALVAALALTAFWALRIAFGGTGNVASGLAETLRNGAWLAFMYLAARELAEDEAPAARWLKAVYAALALTLICQGAIDLLLDGAPRLATIHEAAGVAAMLMRALTAAGALLLVHDLSGGLLRAGRRNFACLAGALATLWAYELNLYLFAYLAPAQVPMLAAMRGLLLAALAPVVALGLRRNEHWRLQMSRPMTFRSLSLLAVAGYVAGVTGMAMAAGLLPAPYDRVAQVALVFLLSVVMLVLLPSVRFRAWARVQIAKHLFAHRYDYRTEWMRFAETVGQTAEAADPLPQRALAAVTRMTGATGGLLALRGEDGALHVAALLDWPAGSAAGQALDPSVAARLERDGRIVDLAEETETPALALPAWALAAGQGWALAPLLHFGHLTGVILLTRPVDNRPLDWEDLDMLRVVGRQVASYVSEARGQAALHEAQRFDEFNRRFAFILHDIKNLASQIGLLARNSERHAENPAFRSDMILSLKELSARMGDMLARLNRQEGTRQGDTRDVDLAALATRIARLKSNQHPVQVEASEPVRVRADPLRLEQAIAHVVQNAIEASPADMPVTLCVGREGAFASVEIIDRGNGMSAEFVRGDLFRPFASTKPNGFGIGAYEARALALSMGGRLDVESAPGRGSRFVFILPAAANRLTEQAA